MYVYMYRVTDKYYLVLLFCLYLWVQVFGPSVLIRKGLETLLGSLRMESRDVRMSSSGISSMS